MTTKQNIADEIKLIRDEIRVRELQVDENSIAKTCGFYDRAKEVCDAAEALSQDTDNNALLNTIYLALEHTRRTVRLPSLTNATNLSNYQHGVCLSPVKCKPHLDNQFWGALKTFTGAAFYVAGLVCMFALPVLTAFSAGAVLAIALGGMLIGSLLFKYGAAQQQKGKKDYDELNEHTHLNETDKQKSNHFYSKLSLFSYAAKNVGSEAERAFEDKAANEKAVAIDGFVKQSHPSRWVRV